MLSRKQFSWIVVNVALVTLVTRATLCDDLRAMNLVRLLTAMSGLILLLHAVTGVCNAVLDKEPDFADVPRRLFPWWVGRTRATVVVLLLGIGGCWLQALVWMLSYGVAAVRVAEAEKRGSAPDTPEP